MARIQQYALRYEGTEREAWQAAADRAGLPLAATPLSPPAMPSMIRSRPSVRPIG
jgi:hypothetical protein